MTSRLRIVLEVNLKYPRSLLLGRFRPVRFLFRPFPCHRIPFSVSATGSVQFRQTSDRKRPGSDQKFEFSAAKSKSSSTKMRFCGKIIRLIVLIVTVDSHTQVDHSGDRIRSNLSRFRYSFCRFRSAPAGSDRIRRIPCLRIPAGSSREISDHFLAVSGRTFVGIERNQLPKR